MYSMLTISGKIQNELMYSTGFLQAIKSIGVNLAG